MHMTVNFKVNLSFYTNSDTVGLCSTFSLQSTNEQEQFIVFEIQRTQDTFCDALLWHTQHVTIFIGYVLGKENICFLVCNNFFISSAKNISLVRKRSHRS